MCVPIVVGRDVLAILNVDNPSLTNASSHAELKPAWGFGQPFRAIVPQS